MPSESLRPAVSSAATASAVVKFNQFIAGQADSAAAIAAALVKCGITTMIRPIYGSSLSVQVDDAWGGTLNIVPDSPEAQALADMARRQPDLVSSAFMDLIKGGPASAQAFLGKLKQRAELLQRM